MSVADTQASNKHVVTELFEACFNHGDLERLPRPIAEEYQAHNGQPGPPAFASTITQIRTTLSGLHCDVRDIVAKGDQVAVRWRLAGTQDGSFRGFPPTHRKIETIGIAIFTLENRKIVRASILTDQLGFLSRVVLFRGRSTSSLTSNNISNHSLSYPKWTGSFQEQIA